MAAWEITFHFDNCTPKVLVNGETKEEAVDNAREQRWPPVPQYIKASARQMAGRGGARPGSGRKAGLPNIKNRRTLRMALRWSPAEWEHVKDRAKKKKMTVADYQRTMILAGETIE